MVPAGFCFSCKRGIMKFMTPQIQEQLNQIEIKVEDVTTSVKKIERYLKWTFWITFFFLVAPLLFLLVALPSLLSGLSAVTNSLVL